MAKITYEDKEFLNKNENIADKNKVNDTDLNEIKEVVNGNDDNIGNLSDLNTSDKTSLVNAINEVNLVGKSVQLSKKTQQNINKTTVTKVNWEVEEFNTTKGVLIKDGNNIKCTNGTHRVLVNAGIQTIYNGALDINDNAYIYIRKLTTSSSTQEIKTMNSLTNPSINIICELQEGESLYVETYFANDSGRITNSSDWNWFSVTLLD